MESFILVMTTLPSREEAEQLAERLLKARLIACANIVPAVSSLFHWKGKLDRAEEVLVLMKSRKKYFKDLTEWIQAHHSYEVPEIIALPIVAGSQEYLDWIEEETSLADWN